MKYTGIMYHGADECWSTSSNVLLEVLMSSNVAMAKERRGPKGRVDRGTIFQDGVEKYQLKDEHWCITR